MFLIKKRLKRLRQEKEEFQRSLNSMTLDVARSRAMSALVNAVQCMPVERPNIGQTTEFPRTTGDIFGRYERIVFPGGAVLELGRREYGFINVGRTFDGSELLMRETDQVLFEFEGKTLPTLEDAPDYPSVFHWIVKVVEP